MKKIIWLTVGALVVGGIFIRERNKRLNARKDEKRKPKAGGYAPGRGTTATEPDWSSPFDMNYTAEVAGWLAPRRIIPADGAKAALLAEQIRNARSDSWLGSDDTEAVDTVFSREVKDAVEIAEISRKFHWLYRTDLWEFLNSFLSESELETYVSRPVRLLPPYRLLNP